jgi:hypothetical protein
VAEIVVEIAQPAHGERLTDVEGLLLEPLHPGVADVTLARWYRVRVPPGREPAELAHRLLQDPRVESAYVKPPDAAP